ncbi:transglycosylase family protein [Streptomyces fuscigenes]|uniref:transglycosylase family protein n=1 Tax=Streptomyces fuscigenes TaxID=1528880 RepID=UPI0027DEAC80|nr:transglycosylase family protein [Streptomyces fuscigenes]
MTGSAIAIPLLGAASANAADASTWDKVAACESGGVWNANLSNGYFGGVQISQDAWDEFGGSDYASRPDLATRTQQIAVAEKILAAQGSGTWANCADEAGLSKAASATGSGGSDDSGTLGSVVGGLLGGSHDSGGSDDSGTPDPGTSATPDAPDDSATPDPSTSSGTQDGGQGSGATTGSSTPSGSTSPGATGSTHGGGHGSPHATGGKHRAPTHATGSTDDGGIPLSVSHDNSGGIPSAPVTGGVGSIGNGDLPGVVPDSGTARGGAPLIRIPFAPQYPGAQADAARSPWQFPAEVPWASGTGTQAAGQDGAATPSVPGASAANGAQDLPGASGTTGAALPSTAGGKHRAGSAADASGTSALPTTGSTVHNGHNGQNGQSGATADTSSRGAAAGGGSGERYVVHAGDSLIGIAASQRVDGGWHALYEANKAALGSDPNHIVPGQSLDLGVG